MNKSTYSVEKLETISELGVANNLDIYSNTGKNNWHFCEYSGRHNKLVSI